MTKTFDSDLLIYLLENKPRNLLQYNVPSGSFLLEKGTQ
jgi:hypothetical protein